MPFSFVFYTAHLRSAGPRTKGALKLIRTSSWVLLLGGICSIWSVAAIGQTSLAPKSHRAASRINDRSLDSRAEAILKGMTLQEKVGQLVQYSAGQPTGPGTG